MGTGDATEELLKSCNSMKSRREALAQGADAAANKQAFAASMKVCGLLHLS